MLHSLRLIDEDMFRELLALDPTFPKIYDASKQWLEKDE
jgi:hypothetical protein